METYISWMVCLVFSACPVLTFHRYFLSWHDSFCQYCDTKPNSSNCYFFQSSSYCCLLSRFSVDVSVCGILQTWPAPRIRHYRVDTAAGGAGTPPKPSAPCVWEPPPGHAPPEPPPAPRWRGVRGYVRTSASYHRRARGGMRCRVISCSCDSSHQVSLAWSVLR